jgi:calcium-dependent protein kinase
MNKYILHDCIGSGGYSTVYKCTDAIGVRYAIKQLPKSKNKRIRIQQEISIMKMLKDSPKIVTFRDAGEDEENFYIVQDWCRGGDVKDYMSNYDNYAENTVASVIRGVLRGLVHMHQYGVIHRDIKAGNIMLGDRSEDADVKIGDFEVDDLVGTPWFMAPENLSSKYHTKSDIWSLGVMTYQLLSGKMPFNDNENPFNPSLSKIWNQILFTSPKMSGSKWTYVSEDAKDFVHQCLIKDYKERPSAMELLTHPWLTKSDCNDRFKGKPLSCKPFKFEDVTMMKAKTITFTMDDPTTSSNDSSKC